MRNPPPARKRASPARTARNTTIRSTTLVVLDQAPFLKKALSTCRRLRKELHKKQGLLSEFEDEDRAAYEQWVNRTHGAKLTKIRELEEEQNAYSFILSNLANCAFYCPEKLVQVHKELFKRKAEGTLHEFVPPRDEDDEDDEPEGDEDDWDDEMDQAMKDIFDEMFGDEEDSGEDAHKDFGGFGNRVPESAKKPAHDPRLKACYRALAKRLHPDHSQLEESLREKRWHEIQEAYHNGDLEGLLRVEAICDMDETGLTITLGLARLKDLARYHQSHLKPIRSALRAAKYEVAFGFKEKGATETIRRNILNTLNSAIDRLNYQVDYMRTTADEHITDEYEEDEEEKFSRTIIYSKPESKSKPESEPKSKSKPIDPRQMEFF